MQSGDPATAPEPNQLNPFCDFRCLTTINVSISHHKVDLKPWQPAHNIGTSNAKRLIKRATLCKTDTDDPVFTFLEDQSMAIIQPASAVGSNNAAVTPFDKHPPPKDTSPPPHGSSPKTKKPSSSSFSTTSSAARSSSESGSLGNTVRCYATHAEDAAHQREAALKQREKTRLVASLNASRRVEGAPALRVSPLLAQYAQGWADAATTTATREAGIDAGHRGRGRHPNDSPSSSSPSPRDGGGGGGGDAVEIFRASTSRARVARLESPPGMGALAAGEMWYGGKYRRHLCGVVHAHRRDCPCRLRLAFETLVDPAWTAIGVGWGVDGRWVVELGEGVGEVG